MAVSIALYYISLLSWLGNIEDQKRNPNKNNRDHLVGRPTNGTGCIMLNTPISLLNPGSCQQDVEESLCWLVWTLCQLYWLHFCRTSRSVQIRTLQLLNIAQTLVMLSLVANITINLSERWFHQHFWLKQILTRKKVVGNVWEGSTLAFFGRTSQSSYYCFDGPTTGYHSHFIFRYLFNNFYPSLVVVVMDEDVKTLRI